jgi:hypothetical protein
LEKEALEGVFAEAVDEYGASLWPLCGYVSESFAFEWATEINAYVEQGKRVAIYYFGDHDPEGLDIERDMIAKLNRFGAEFSWARKGLLYEDFDRFNLVNVPVKTKSVRAPAYLKQFGNRAAELDALPPNELHRRINECFVSNIDHEVRRRLLRNEAAERETLRLIATNWKKVAAFVAGGK